MTKSANPKGDSWEKGSEPWLDEDSNMWTPMTNSGDGRACEESRQAVPVTEGRDLVKRDTGCWGVHR